MTLIAKYDICKIDGKLITGDKLCELIKILGVPQKVFAKMMDLPEESICRMINGKQEIKRYHKLAIVKIAEIIIDNNYESMINKLDEVL